MPQFISNVMKRYGLVNKWSASKLIQLYECPLAFYFRYLLKIEVPLNPHLVFGEAVHYMLRRFFKVKYKSPERFAGAWKNFWFGVVRGEHGASGYNMPPLIINFREPPKEPGQLGGLGINIMKKFYEDNIIYREKKELIPQTEKGFAFDFAGMKISGKMDRLQPQEDGTDEIWDYKPRTPSKANIRDDVQLTLYNLAYKKQYGKNPSGLVIYNYKTGEQHWVKPRKEKYYQELFQWLNEARAYVWGVLFWRQYQLFPFKFNLEQFHYFNARDVQDSSFSPSFFPNAHQCKFCHYYKPCEDWRKQKSHLVVNNNLIRIKKPKKNKVSIQQELFLHS